MSEILVLHPSQNNPRLMKVVVDCLRLGGVIAYPTDSGYALGCGLKQKQAASRMRAIRGLDLQHPFTLICRDLSDISHYAKVSTQVFRILKRLTPGGYTFILEATKWVPDLVSTKQKTIGIRIPDHPIPLMIAEALGEPLLSTSLMMPGETVPLLYSEEVADRLGDRINLLIEGGYAGFEPTSIISLLDEVPVVVRVGSGPVGEFLK